MTRPALIAGATGLVGTACLHELLQDPVYDRIDAIVRKPLPVTSSKLTEIRGDIDHFPALPAMPNAAVFCALGTTIRKAGSQAAFRRVDYEYPLQIAKASLSAGATDFVLVSSVGADKPGGNFYLSVKHELEQAIGTLGFRSLHILRPSILTGDRPETRTGERIGIVLASAIQFLLIGGLSKYKPIAAEDVGRAMVRCVTPRATGTQIYHWREINKLSSGADHP
jgi:uncharacterized protein YbjT (DUF2867 family)